MSKVKKLINEISNSRKKYLLLVSSFSEDEGKWKPSPEEWNMTEITEHLFWAEQGGILGMWKTIDGIREGKIERKYDSIHKDMPVEQIVALTWKDKEQVPAVAAPRLSGPLSFWCASLASLQQVLEAFGDNLREDELRLQAHPHPISGEIDFQQRLEFLRFHLDRHQKQVARLISEMKQRA
jgi:hypothetical protein